MAIDPCAKLEEILQKLDARGVDSDHISNFFSNMLGGKLPEDATASYPGFDYGLKVTRAVVKTMETQAKEANRAWGEMRNGRYGLGSAMRTWARSVEAWADIAVEASKGPAHQPTPTWVVFDARQKKETYEREIHIEADAGKLDVTDFWNVAGGSHHSLYYDETLLKNGAQGTRLRIHLNRKAVDRLAASKAGVFVSVVFPAQRGPAEAVAIVVLLTGGKTTRP
jgi:hypothetical protein